MGSLCLCLTRYFVSPLWFAGPLRNSSFIFMTEPWCFHLWCTIFWSFEPFWVQYVQAILACWVFWSFWVPFLGHQFAIFWLALIKEQVCWFTWDQLIALVLLKIFFMANCVAFFTMMCSLITDYPFILHPILILGCIILGCHIFPTSFSFRYSTYIINIGFELRSYFVVELFVVVCHRIPTIVFQITNESVRRWFSDIKYI